MRRKLAFLVAVFCATVLAMAVQKPVFMAWYAAEAAGAGFGGWMEVLWHGLTLDMTVAGYVTALPLLAVLLSLWVRIPERVWRGVLTAYFALIAVVTAVIFAVDVALYEHWGFRIDATVLIYLSDPEEAMASVDFWLGVRQTLLAAAYAARCSGPTVASCAFSTDVPSAGGWPCPEVSSSSCSQDSTSWRSAAGWGPRWPMFRRSISAPCRF